MFNMGVLARLAGGIARQNATLWNAQRQSTGEQNQRFELEQLTREKLRQLRRLLVPLLCWQ